MIDGHHLSTTATVQTPGHKSSLFGQKYIGRCLQQVVNLALIAQGSMSLGLGLVWRETASGISSVEELTQHDRLMSLPTCNLSAAHSRSVHSNERVLTILASSIAQFRVHIDSDSGSNSR